MEKLIIRIYSQEEEDKVFEFVDVDNAGGVVYHYQGKPFTGIIQHFDIDNLVAEEEFTDGHIGGVQRKYYSNGQMQEECYQYFGKLDKYFKAWDENGNLLHHSVWKEGTRLQTVKEW